MPSLPHYGGPISDQWLVAAAQRGDRRAADAILRRYDRRVHAIVGELRLPRGVEPHDVIQAARLGVFGAILTWRPTGAPFHVYAKTCARRRAFSAIDDARTARRRTLTDAASLDNLAETGREPACHPWGLGDPLATALAREELAAILAALPALTARQAACLKGQLNGHSYAEVASAVGGTTKSVAMCVRRARACLVAAARLD
jgi:RNA polymerase sigma factor (sigma-70 family)